MMNVGNGASDDRTSPNSKNPTRSWVTRIGDNVACPPSAAAIHGSAPHAPAVMTHRSARIRPAG